MIEPFHTIAVTVGFVALVLMLIIGIMFIISRVISLCEGTASTFEIIIFAVVILCCAIYTLYSGGSNAVLKS